MEMGWFYMYDKTNNELVQVFTFPQHKHDVLLRMNPHKKITHGFDQGYNGKCDSILLISIDTYI